MVEPPDRAVPGGRVDHPAQPAPAPVRTRRRAPIIAVGIALIVLGTLGFTFLLQSAGNSVTVLVTRGEILRGEVIDSSALSEIQIVEDQSVDAFTVDEASQLVGLYATVDLPPGSLLSSSNTAPSVGVPDGQSLVGVPLGPGQMPASRIVAGDHVRLVGTQLLDTTGRSAADADPLPVDAVVSAVVRDDASGVTIVDVLVPSHAAPALASRAAAGTLALVLDPAG